MIRLAVVGTGYWGKNIVRAFSNTQPTALYACCDADQDRLQQIKTSYPGIQAYTSYDTLLQDTKVDGIAIATPSPTHFMLARQALGSGKHVYVEKPMTMTASESSELIELAAHHSRILMVGHLMIYHPAIQKLKVIIDSGELGDIFYVYTQRLNLGIIRENENAWWSLAPHDISIILYLSGSVPSRISVNGQGYLRSHVQDVVFADLQFEDGRMAQIHVSWLDPHKIRKLTVVGSRKMVVFDDMEPIEKLKIYDKGVEGLGYESYGDALTLRQGEIYIPNVTMEEPLKRECQHFVECVIHGHKPVTDGENGLAVVKILEAGQQSLDSSGAFVDSL
ncbi:MAG: Gfo/Idh/MocA family oxidoreductase [Gemmatimonadota bacterium]|nr:Gfo/Idh/MocA family oxidoreductase [Gemmatimonadota bacterium]